MEHVVYIWNHLPNQHTGLSPNEIFSQSLEPNLDYFKMTQVWGCPTYVLEPNIQDGRKIPKWQPKSRREAFLGFSKQHSSIIGLILNLRTGSITPQYHVVYEDLFTTVTNCKYHGISLEHQIEDWRTLV